MSPVPSIRRRHGFSLTELLVVIGIIALLIGIILPVVSSAREKSRRVACQSNLRVIGQSMFMYANAFNGRLPNGNPPETWNSLTDQSRVLVYFAEEFVKHPGIFGCPSDSDPAPTAITNGNYLQEKSARMSYEFYSIWWAPEYGPLLSKLQSSNKKTSSVFAPLAWDQFGGAKSNRMKSHRGGGNVVFADGHVEWQPAVEWETSAKAPASNGAMPNPADEFWPLADDILG